MMKIHGKEYAYGILKVFLPDQSFKQLSELTKYLNQPNNAHSLVVIINMLYNDMIKQKDLADMAKTRAENEAKRRAEQVGNQGQGFTP